MVSLQQEAGEADIPLERGISAFLGDQSLEPASSLEQWAQPGLPVPGRLHCSAPGFIFVRAWSGGGGDQVTVPEERWHRLSCHRECTWQREQGAGTDGGEGLDGQGGILLMGSLLLGALETPGYPGVLGEGMFSQCGNHLTWLRALQSSLGDHNSDCALVLGLGAGKQFVRTESWACRR